MSMPYRPMWHWGQMPVLHAFPGADFRTPMPAADWNPTSALGGQDPRETPSGDIARAGTIPDYVPYAVINPRRPVTVPQ